jgi:hypothetical protein
LPEGGRTCAENDFKGPMGMWDAMYVSPSVVPLAWSSYGWWHLDSLIWTNRNLSTAPPIVWTWGYIVQGNLYYSRWVLKAIYTNSSLHWGNAL